jgi:hypothetical protein
MFDFTTMQSAKTIGWALLLSALLVALTGCTKPEGPAEKAGKNLDRAAASVGDQVDKAGEVIKDAANGDNN